MRPGFSILALASVLALAGCARRAHLHPDYGRSHTMFDRQADATMRGSAQGLESEEASAIDQRYRETLGKRGVSPRNDPRSSVLILQEDPNAPAKRK